MKKIIIGVLDFAARLGSRSRRGDLNFASDTEKFHGWLQSKGYLIQEQMADAAVRIGVSQNELALYTQYVFHKPFLTLRKELRIKDAQQLLKDRPDLSCRQVGEMVGIPDSTNFRRQFQEVTGMSIKDYQDKMREELQK